MRRAIKTETDGDPYSQNKVAIARANAYLFKRIVLGACLNMTVLSLASPFMGGFSGAERLYIISAVLTGLASLYAFFLLDKQIKAILPLFYCLLAGLCGYAVALSSFYYPDIHGVTIVAMFVLIPVVILDRAWRVNTVILLLFLISSAFALWRKPLAIAVDDCMTTGAFMVFGMLIGNHMRRTRLNAIIQQHYTQLQRDADVLTGLPNRRVLFETLERAEKDEGSRRVDGMFMIDVDNFKSYNDRYGHQAGDECLRLLGEYFRAFSRECGTQVFRYGGEEFLGLWYEDAGMSLEKMSGCLIDGVGARDLPGERVTISVGYAYRPEDVGTQRLITMADKALYEAKRLGKHRAVRYEHSLDR